MFSKRESNDSESPNRSGSSTPSTGARDASAAAARSTGVAGGAAIIGPSISIDGQLSGEEDLVVEGRIKGTVELKNNTLTIGSQGTLDAEVFAHTIFVEGTVTGDLYASERISIRKSARIQGNILAPRISLEDGAKFRGSIDMDADSEGFRKAFGGQSPSAAAPGSANKKTAPRSDADRPDGNTPGQGSQSGPSAPDHPAQQTGKTGTSGA